MCAIKVWHNGISDENCCTHENFNFILKIENYSNFNSKKKIILLGNPNVHSSIKCNEN